MNRKRGKLEAPVAQRVFWCAFEGLVAIVLLLGGGHRLGALPPMTSCERAEAGAATRPAPS